MYIEELKKESSLQFLAGRHLGRLACVRDSQPYITPFNYVYHQDFIYSFATLGRKVEWLRTNPLACVEVDDIVSPEQWTSVIVLGRYEELSETSDVRVNREFAYKLLQKRDLWWEPGYVKTILHGAPRPLVPVYFRVSIEDISGHRAMMDEAAFA